MLDFDYVCERKRPSVAAMVYPFRLACYCRIVFANKHVDYELEISITHRN